MLEKINLDEQPFAAGTLLCAKESPLVQLRVIRYLQRIYYCERVGRETEKQLAYFHRELLLPV